MVRRHSLLFKGVLDLLAGVLQLFAKFLAGLPNRVAGLLLDLLAGFFQLLAGLLARWFGKFNGDADDSASTDLGGRASRRWAPQAGSVRTGAAFAALCRPASPHGQTVGPHDVSPFVIDLGHGRGSRHKCLWIEKWILRPATGDLHNHRNRNLGCLVALRHSHPHG